MHVGNDLRHAGERLFAGVDDDVDTVAQYVEVGVGHQGRDLDERIGIEPEPGHLTVNPDKFVLHKQHTSVRPIRVGKRCNRANR